MSRGDSTRPSLPILPYNTHTMVFIRVFKVPSKSLFFEPCHSLERFIGRVTAGHTHTTDIYRVLGMGAGETTTRTY